MANGSAALGIKRLENIDFFVHDLARSQRFYTELFDFAWTAQSSAAHEATSRQRSHVYAAGEIQVTATQPLAVDSESGRYLKSHPDGVARLTFEVADVDATLSVLRERGATVTSELQVHRDDRGGTWRAFDITTPFGEALFRFVQRDGFDGQAPGMEPFAVARGGSNRLGFERYDHITSNFLTLKPMELWCTHVLGLEPFWNIEFHTDDVAPEGDHGSGLKSVVLWDPHSGVKFANNEPRPPHFEASQIYGFVMDNHGPGIQHAALTTADLLATIKGLGERDVSFMETPDAYYDQLPARLERMGIGAIDEDIEVLRQHGILVDGKDHHSYLLQIFLKEAAGLYGDEKAGPFFFEIIQRKGDEGFGEGNFRALFESIERGQKAG